jgi:hypothetical protein
MTPSLQKVLESKRALRGELATRPVAEKLRMLEAMRERAITIRDGGEETRRSSIRAK